MKSINIRRKIALVVSILVTIAIIGGGVVLAGTAKSAAETLSSIYVGAGWSESWDESDGTVYENLSYGASRRNVYDLYIPNGLDRIEPQGVILFIHGGSWNFGNKDAMDFAAAKYAKQGYITATMSYTLISGGNLLFSLLSGSPNDATVFDMLEDVDACIKALKEEINNLGYETDGLALAGMSSGSHIALLYGYSMPERSAIPLKLILDQTGPVDMHPETWNNDNYEGMALYLKMWTGIEVTGDSIKNRSEATEAIINSISPIYFINENSVPTLMGYAGKDTVVGTNQYPTIKAVLDQYGIPNDVVMYPNSEHTLDSDPESANEWDRKSLEWLDSYLDN